MTAAFFALRRALFGNALQVYPWTHPLERLGQRNLGSGAGFGLAVAFGRDARARGADCRSRR